MTWDQIVGIQWEEDELQFVVIERGASTFTPTPTHLVLGQ